MNKRLVVFLLLVVIGIAAYSTVSSGLLTLDSLRSYQSTLLEVVHQRPIISALAYFCIYVLITALSIPGAIVMTLAGGAIFGVVFGTALVSISSTVGATLAFLIARTLARPLIRQKFSDRLQKVQTDFEKDGALYLFTLRLVPVIPFFVINVVMALTSIRTRVFFLVSFLGMLPATVVNVNAGTQLSSIEAIGDILSPKVLLSFALLAVFPWLARAVVKAVRKS